MPDPIDDNGGFGQPQPPSSPQIPQSVSQALPYAQQAGSAADPNIGKAVNETITDIQGAAREHILKPTMGAVDATWDFLDKHPAAKQFYQAMPWTPPSREAGKLMGHGYLSGFPFMASEDLANHYMSPDGLKAVTDMEQKFGTNGSAALMAVGQQILPTVATLGTSKIVSSTVGHLLPATAEIAQAAAEAHMTIPEMRLGLGETVKRTLKAMGQTVPPMAALGAGWGASQAPEGERLQNAVGGALTGGVLSAGTIAALGFGSHVYQGFLRHGEMIDNALPHVDTKPDVLPTMDTSDVEGHIKYLASRVEQINKGVMTDAQRDVEIRGVLEQSQWAADRAKSRLTIANREAIDAEQHHDLLTQDLAAAKDPQSIHDLQEQRTDIFDRWRTRAREADQSGDQLARYVSVMRKLQLSPEYEKSLNNLAKGLERPIPETVANGQLVPRTPQGHLIPPGSSFELPDKSIWRTVTHQSDGTIRGIHVTADGDRITRAIGPGVLDGAHPITPQEATRKVQSFPSSVKPTDIIQNLPEVKGADLEQLHAAGFTPERAQALIELRKAEADWRATPDDVTKQKTVEKWTHEYTKESLSTQGLPREALDKIKVSVLDKNAWYAKWGEAGRKAVGMQKGSTIDIRRFNPDVVDPKRQMDIYGRTYPHEYEHAIDTLVGKVTREYQGFYPTPEGPRSPLTDSLSIGPSPLHGHGVFASKPLPAGVHVPYDPYAVTATGFRGFNHSDTPNAELVSGGIRPLRNISPNQEITLKYLQPGKDVRAEQVPYKQRPAEVAAEKAERRHTALRARDEEALNSLTPEFHKSLEVPPPPAPPAPPPLPPPSPSIPPNPANIPTGAAINMAETPWKWPGSGIIDTLRRKTSDPYYRLGEEKSWASGELKAYKALQDFQLKREVKNIFDADPALQSKTEQEKFYQAVLSKKSSPEESVEALSRLGPQARSLAIEKINSIQDKQRSLINRGMLKPETVAKRLDTDGELYLHREYAARAAPDRWKNYIEQQQRKDAPLWTKTLDYLRGENERTKAGKSDWELQQYMHDLLTTSPERMGTQPLDEVNATKRLWTNSKLNKDMFRQRGDIPEQLRDFLGQDRSAYSVAHTEAMLDGHLYLHGLYDEISKDPTLSSPNGQPGMRFLENDPNKYGNLAGKFIDHRLYEQMTDLQAAPSEIQRLLQNATSSWKWGQIVLDARSWSHRFIHNSAFATMSGLVPWRPLESGQYMLRAGKLLADTNNPELADAYKHNVIGHETGNTELYSAHNELARKLQLIPDRTGLGHVVDTLRDGVAALGQKSSHGYDAMDRIWKVASWLRLKDEALARYRFDPLVQSLGVNRYAALKVNESFPNPAFTSPVVKQMSAMGPMFNPILRFQAGLLRIAASLPQRTLQDPSVGVRMLAFASGIAASKRFMQHMGGYTDADMKAAENGIADSTLSTMPSHSFLPSKDAFGRPQILDTTRIPLILSSLAGNPQGGALTNAARNIMMTPFSGGLSGAVLEQNFPSLSTMEHRDVSKLQGGVAAAWKTYELIAPGIVKDIQRSLHGSLDESTLRKLPEPLGQFVGSRSRNEPQLTPGQAIARPLGARIVPVSPEGQRAAFKEAQGAVKEAAGERKAIQKQPGAYPFGVNKQTALQEKLQEQREKLRIVREKSAARMKVPAP